MDEHERLEHNRKLMDFLAVAFLLGSVFGALACCGGIAYVIHNYLTS